VWAWQAKYLFEFDSSAAAQVTSSVRRVLDREPSLKRYFVTLPLDLPAGDTEKRESAYTRWTGKVSEWEAAARNKGLEVGVYGTRTSSAGTYRLRPTPGLTALDQACLRDCDSLCNPMPSSAPRRGHRRALTQGSSCETGRARALGAATRTLGRRPAAPLSVTARPSRRVDRHAS
jgi:hypothetical protein